MNTGVLYFVAGMFTMNIAKVTDPGTGFVFLLGLAITGGVALAIDNIKD